MQKTLALEVDTSFLPSHRQSDPRTASKEGYWAMSGSRHNAVSKKMADQRMAGLGGLGATVTVGDDLTVKTPMAVDLMVLVVGGYAAVKMFQAATTEKTQRSKDLLDAGVHKAQKKKNQGSRRRRPSGSSGTPSV
tara:strand:- start:17 stop:421 length:405 start_codon:yes stop_codon:yes gene_type:complete